MALSWAAVTARAPETSTASAATQTAILADVIEFLGATPGNFSTAARYEQAGAYLCAHMATLATTAGSGGQLVSESVGPLSASYAAAATSDAGLESTSYGQEFKRLCRAYIITASWFVS